MQPKKCRQLNDETAIRDLNEETALDYEVAFGLSVSISEGMTDEELLQYLAGRREEILLSNGIMSLECLLYNMSPAELFDDFEAYLKTEFNLKPATAKRISDVIRRLYELDVIKLEPSF